MPNPWNKRLFYHCWRLAFWGLAAGSLFLPAFCPDLVGAVEQPLPFSPGEEVCYEVRWQTYKAGEALVKVLPFTKINGRRAWHFQLQAESNEFIDRFFKIRDHIQGFTDGALTGSVRYRYSGRGKKKKEVRVTFSPKQNTATYSNFDKHKDPIKIPHGSFDPLSSYFKMRAFNLVPGAALSFPVTDGKKAFTQKGDVVGRERIKLTSGEYDTVVVVPWVTHFSGVFKKSKDPTVRVWITDDTRKIPVRIQIKVVIGAIYLDLKRYVPGQHG